MAIICDDLRLLFIMVPGTGCSVVGRVLEDQFGGRFLPPTDVVVDGQVTHPMKHNSVGQLLSDGLIDEATLDDYLVVATVRDPRDRAATYFQRLVGGWHDQSFEFQRQRLESERDRLSEPDYHARRLQLGRRARRVARRRRVVSRVGFNAWFVLSSVRELLGRVWGRSDRHHDLMGRVDVAVRYEHLESGVNSVLGMLGAKGPISLPRRNQTPGKRPYLDYYGPFSLWVANVRFGRATVRGDRGDSGGLLWLNEGKRERYGRV